jgi:hypothetical protein
MTRTDLRIVFEIRDYWTPAQALAVYELLDGLRDLVVSRYKTQIMDALREECAPSSPAQRNDDRDPDTY